jgi:hypothetical protein
MGCHRSRVTKATEEKNAENLLIVKSKELARIYTGNWNKHRHHSERRSPGDQIYAMILISYVFWQG